MLILSLIFQILVGVIGGYPAATATPGFVSETSKNSTKDASWGGSASALGAKTYNSCSSYSYCLSFPDPSPGAGNLGIIVFQYNHASTAVTTTVTDDQSNSWTCLSSSAQIGSGYWVNACYAPNMASGTHAVTLTFGTTVVTQVMAKVSQFYNIATLSPLDCSSLSVGSSSSTVNVGSCTTTAANDLVYVYTARVGTPAVTSFTAASGYTLLTTDINDGGASEYGVVSGTGATTPTMTMASASTYGEVVLGFKSATAGTAPTGTYIDRLMSWSSPGSLTSNFNLQFPSVGNFLFASSPCGGPTAGMLVTGVTDSTNTWNLAGNTPGGSNATLAATSELYASNAVANPSGLLTMVTSGTGDCTFTLYDFVGAPSDPLVARMSTANGYSEVASASLALGTLYTPVGFSILTLSQYQNTSIGVTLPASGCVADMATYGGMSVNGPEPLDENNGYGHCYFASSASRAYSFTMTDAELAPLGFVADIVAVIVPQAVNIIHTSTGTGTTTTLALSVTATTAGNMGVVAVGNYKSASPFRTVSSVCFDGTTCATGNHFTQLTGATTTGTANQGATDIWYLLSMPAGKTTVTITYSGALNSTEAMYYEVTKPSGSWVVDNSGAGVLRQNGSVSGGTATGPTITPSGSPSFCVAYVSVQDAVTQNPNAGNPWVYGGNTFSSSGDAVSSLITSAGGSQIPVWQDASGNFNASAGCFK